MDAPTLFLSYASADRGIAERLRTGLEKHGCLVYDPAANGRFQVPATASYADLEEAAKRSDQFVLLFGKHRDRDRLQEQEWQAALEASWDDASKKMIPVLLGDAELPSFVRGAAGSGRSSMGLHVSGLRDAERAAEMIARAVGGEPSPQRTVRKRALGNSHRSIEDDDFGGEELDAPTRGYSLEVPDDSEKPERRPRHKGAPSAVERSEDDDHGLSFAVEPPDREEIEARFAEIRRYAKELER